MRYYFSFLLFCIVATTNVMGQKKSSLLFYGAPIEFSSYTIKENVLLSFEDDKIAEDINKMKTIEYTRLLHDCIILKEELKLNDWGYLKLVDKIAHSFLQDNNKAVLLTAMLMSGNGYKVKIGKADTKLYLFLASDCVIYEDSYITCNNTAYYAYPIQEKLNKITVCTINIIDNGSRPVSPKIAQLPKLPYKPSVPRERKASKYPEWNFSISCNHNLIDFYNDMPVFMYDGDFMTRWIHHSNTPLSEEVQHQLYPRMYQLVKGLSQREAVERILNWIQTGFEYGSDEKVWGKKDRSFYPEETLYYPQSDTEDRSALMARVITDVLGLKTLFIYYPGHTAVGVAFTDEDVEGDHVMFEGQKYLICDGVFIEAPVGRLLSYAQGKEPKMAPVAPAQHISENQPTTVPKIKNETTRNVLTASAHKSNDTTFVVIVGNENYHLVTSVPYANNDAQSFADCCRNTLGVPQKNIKVYKDATYGTMISAVNSLKRIAKAYSGQMNVIFYYAGHGIPNEETGDSYLLPIDGDGLNTEVCYPLNRLYQELDGLNARHVTVFLDACFSGSQRGNGMIVAARGVAIKAKHDAPKGNTVVFCAASGKQTAYPYKEKEHGMFTYYLLKKLEESDGNCTLGELGDYVGIMVNRQAVVTNDKEQTPLILTPAGNSVSWKHNKLK